MTRSNIQFLDALMRFLSKHNLGPLLISSACIASLIAIPAKAQPEGFEQTDEEKKGAVCMVGTTAKGGELPIILPGSDEAAMAAKGFDKEPCGKAFQGRSNIEQWRDYVCQIASVRSEETQENYEANWGERPAVLCGMAEVTSSQWKRRAR